MRPLTIVCGVLLLANAIEFLTGCGIQEEGRRQRETVYVTRHSADAHAGEGLASGNSSSGGVSSGEESKSTDESLLAEVQVRFGIRDFAQINATMEKLTGIPASTAAIRTVYAADLMTQLPTSNDLKAFLSSHQVGISKLATEYCDALMTNTTLRGALLVGFNFNLPPATALADGPANAISAALLDKFVGMPLEFHPDRDFMASEVKNLIRELVRTAPQANAAQTLSIVKGACTAVLASSSVTTL